MSTLGELEFHRLLVAVDGSEGSDLALSAAITAARRSHATVTLVAVATTVPAWPDASLQGDVDEAAEKILREAVAKIPEDVPVTTVWRKGKPGPEIVAVAGEGTYDAIIMGARGVGKFASSVSQYVLHHSPVSVLIAHPPGRTS